MQTFRVNVKLKFVLKQAIKALSYSCTLSLTLLLDVVGGKRHTPAALFRGKRPGAHCAGGCVGRRVGLDECGKSRPLPLRDSIPGPSDT